MEKTQNASENHSHDAENILTPACGCEEESACRSTGAVTQTNIDTVLTNGQKQSLERTGFKLSVFTVIYNVFEGVISVIFGLLAGSVALFGFGIDSFVESLSGGVMIWRFKRREGINHNDEEQIEQKAAKLVGISLLVLGAYIAYESIVKVISGVRPEPTFIGIVIALVSLVVMPVLFYLKRKTARSLGSGSLMADSKQTLACIFLSISLLIGLTLNYLFALWWADHAAAVVISIYILWEGVETLRGGELCSC